MTTKAAGAGTWMLGDLTANRMGFGAMRLAGARGGVPGDRAQAISVLRRAVELGVNHIDTASLRLSPQEISSLAATPLPSSPDPAISGRSHSGLAVQ